MEKVTEIGGFFFRAKDPKALWRWYQEHLGISLTPSSYEDSIWQQGVGPTVFDPQPETSDLFKGTDKGLDVETFESGISTSWQPSYEPLQSQDSSAP
jgi:hypothetical protein